MPFVSNGSRVCDTTRNPLVGIDVSYTLVNNTDIIILAAGMAVTAGDEAKGGNPHTWQFRQLGGIFVNITTVSEVRFADSTALVHNTLVSSANRRGNLTPDFVQSGREFETANDLTANTLKSPDETETQIALTFEFAIPGQAYEFQVLWEDKNNGPTPSPVQSFITAAVSEKLLDAVITGSGSIATDLSVASLFDSSVNLDATITTSLFSIDLFNAVATAECVIASPELFLPGQAAIIPGTDSAANTTRYATRGASHIWWNFDKNRWDGVLPKLGDYFVVKDIRSATPVFTTVLFSTANASIHDIIYDSNNRTVYGLVSHATSGDASTATYDPVTDTYTLVINRVPASAGFSDRKAPGVIHKTPNGFLWTAIHTTSGVIIDQSINDGATWLATPFNLVNTGDWGRVDLSHFAFGGNTFLVILIMEQELSAPAEQRCYIINQTASPVILGSYTQETLPAFLGTEESYQSSALARDQNDNVYAAVVTGAASSPTDAGLILYKRPSAGVWTRHIIALKSAGFKDASITVDELNGHVYVVFVDAVGDGLYCKAPLSTLVFEAPVLLFTGVNAFEEIEVPNHNVSGTSGLQVVIRDTVTRQNWQTNIALNQPITDIFLDAVSTGSASTLSSLSVMALFDTNIDVINSTISNLSTEITVLAVLSSSAVVTVSGLSIDILMDATTDASVVITTTLTTEINLSTSLIGSGLIVSPLFTEITLSSTLINSTLTIAELMTSINVAGTITSQINIFSDFFTEIIMSSNILTSVNIIPDFTVSENIFFNAGINSSANIIPDLLTSILFNTGINSSINVTPDILTSILFNIGINSSVNIIPDLLTSILFNTGILTSVNIIPDFTVSENIFFNTGINSSANVIPDLLTSILFNTGLVSFSAGTSALTTEVTFVSLLSGINFIPDPLFNTSITLASNAQGSLIITPALVTGVNLQVQLGGLVDVLGALTTDIALISTLLNTNQATSDLSIEANTLLNSIITGSLQVQEELFTTINIVVNLIGDSNLTGNLTLDIRLASNVNLASNISRADLLTELKLSSAIDISGDITPDILTEINISGVISPIVNVLSKLFTIGAIITTIDNRDSIFNKSDFRGAVFNKTDIRKVIVNFIDTRGGIF